MKTLKVMLGTVVCALALAAGIVMPANQAQAAPSWFQPDKKNVWMGSANTTRQEVTPGRYPHGFGTSPQSDFEAQQQGYSYKKMYTVNIHNDRNVWFYVRETEIVPKGEKPSAEDVYRYVYDDGTFKDPGTQPQILSPFRSLGGVDNLPVPSYTFSDPELKKRYTPYNGYMNIAVFYGRNPTNDPKEKKYFYCINPLSYDPESRYILQPTQFSGQTNYQELPEIPYILNVLMKNAGLDNLIGWTIDYYPDWDSAYKSLANAHNIITAGGSSIDEPSVLDPRLTYREVKEYYDKIRTLDGKSHVVDGETIPVQRDRGDGNLAWLDPNPKNAGDDIDERLALGIEYPFNHYCQGIPMGGLDRFEGVSGYWGTYMAERTRYAKEFARTIFAHVEAARAKGLIALDKVGLYEEVKAKTENVTVKDGKANVSVSIDVPVSANSLELTLSDKFTLLDPKPIGQAGNTYKLPLGTKNVQLQYAESSIPVDAHVDFHAVCQVMVNGESYVTRDSYRYDERSGHWIALEFSSFNPHFGPHDYPRWGFSRGQQLVTFMSNVKETDAELRFFPMEKYLKTKVAIGDASAPEGKELFAPAPTSDGVNFKDYLKYYGLTEGAEYALLTTIADKAHPDGTGKPTVVLKRLSYFTARAADGEHVVSFDNLKGLKADSEEDHHRYVVYETVYQKDAVKNATVDNPTFDEGKVVTVHENADDLDQCFSFPAPALRTQVSVNDFASTSDSPVVFVDRNDSFGKGLTVRDLVEYKGLEKGKKYTLFSAVHYEGKFNEAPVLSKVTEFTANDGVGDVIVEFPLTKTFKPKAFPFVVSQVLVPSDKVKNPGTPEASYEEKDVVVKHQDARDNAQSFKLGGVVTTIKVGDDAALTEPLSYSLPLGDKGEREVKDFVTIYHAEPGKKYEIQGDLVRLRGGNAAPEVVASGHVVAPDGGNVITIEPGRESVSYDLSFGKAKDILKGAGTYVAQIYLYEVIQDPNDPSKTIAQDFSYINATSLSDPHETIKIDDTLTTLVTANGITATENGPVQLHGSTGDVNATVSDEVTYKTLQAGVEYVIFGELLALDDNGKVKRPAVASTQKAFVAEGPGSKLTVDFGSVSLKPGVTYVVFEEVYKKSDLTESNGSYEPTGDSVRVAYHNDDSDPKQSVRVNMLKTQVKADGKYDENSTLTLEVAKKGDPSLKVNNLTDTITYSGLDSDKRYAVYSELHKITDAASGTTEKVAEARSYLVPAASQPASLEVSFGTQTLEKGATYVVYEYLNEVGPANGPEPATFPELDKQNVGLSHADINDTRQKVEIIEKVGIKTLASTDTDTATADHPALYDVSKQKNETDNNQNLIFDTVSYENLDTNTTYRLFAELYKVENGIATLRVATAYSEAFKPARPSDTIRVSFDEVTREGKTEKFPRFLLNAGSTYVIYETLVKESGVFDVDKGKDDGTAHRLSYNPNSVVAEHKDPADTKQTIVSGRLSTEAGVRGLQSKNPVQVPISGTDTIEKRVIDTVTYKGLEEDGSYVLYGELHEKGGALVKSAGPVSFTASSAGIAEVDFGDVTLAKDKTYVIYEYVMRAPVGTALPSAETVKQNSVIKHVDENDTLQQIVVKDAPFIKTHAIVAEATHDENKSEATDTNIASLKVPGSTQGTMKVKVWDKLKLENLKPNTKYQLKAELYEGANYADYGITYNFTTAADQSEFEVDLPLLKGAQANIATSNIEGKQPDELDARLNTRYKIGTVLLEWSGTGNFATTRQVAFHNYVDESLGEIGNLPAESFEVTNREIRTTVKIGDESAAADKPIVMTVASDKDIVGKRLVDEVRYQNLEVGVWYSFFGEIYEVVPGAGGNTVKPDPVARGSKIFQAAQSNGTETVEFNDLSQLKSGVTYVVFEYLTENNVKNAAGPAPLGFRETAVILGSHEDPNDKSQQFLFKGGLKTTVSIDGKDATPDKKLNASLKGDASIANKTIVDKVAYQNLDPTKRYAVYGFVYAVVDDDNHPDGKRIEGAAVSSASGFFVPDSSGTGVWNLEFTENGQLKPDVDYVVYEYAVMVGNRTDAEPAAVPAFDPETDKSKAIASHEDPKDLSQTFRFSVGLRTTAAVNESEAGDEPANLVIQGDVSLNNAEVTDKVEYHDFDTTKRYVIYGYVYEVTGEPGSKQVTGDPVAGSTATVDPDSPNGEVTLTFWANRMSAGKEYVVYEYAMAVGDKGEEFDPRPLDRDKIVASHEDPNDTRQRFKFTAGSSIGTTVSQGDVSASADAPLEVKIVDADSTVSFDDTVSYKNLTVSTSYVLFGQLMMVDGFRVTPVKDAQAFSEPFRASEPHGEKKVSFTNVKGLEPNKKYVVYETLYLESDTKVGADGKRTVNDNAKPVAEHKNPTDSAQTIVTKKQLKPSIGTTVSKGDVSASADAPLEVKVVDADSTVSFDDTVSYQNLVANASYVLFGQLMKVEGEGDQAVAVPVENARTFSDPFGPAGSNGEKKVAFTDVKGLEPGAKYVVYEELYLEKDTEVDGDGHRTVKRGVTPVATHKDPNDKAQTLVTGVALKTQVVVSEIKKAKGGEDFVPGEQKTIPYAKITDTITYKGMDTASKYLLVGEVYEIQDPENDGTFATVGNPVAKAEVAEYAPQASEGTADMVFEIENALKSDKKYVVYEYAYKYTGTEKPAHDKASVVGKHEDPNDAKQQFDFARPSIGTTVSVGGKASTSENAVEVEVTGSETEVDVVDTVSYKDLTVGTTYVLYGQLMEVDENDVATAVEGAESFSEPFVPQEANGAVEVTFSKVKGLEPGKKYVVFEYLVTPDKVMTGPAGKKTVDKEAPVASHVDPKDKAQTVVVKKPQAPEIKIGTTVTAGGVTASDEARAQVVADEATKVEFSDLVTYEGLTAGASYTMFGELVEVQADGTVKVVAEAPGAEFRPSGATGTLKVDFGKVSGLRPGMTYVVFEYLVSTDKVKVDAATGKKTYDKADVIAKHDDRNDKAQTVVVKKPHKPGKPYVGTRVSANGTEADAAHAAEIVVDEKTAVSFVDTVEYGNLNPQLSYTMFGSLVELQGDGTVKVVAEAPGTEFKPSGATGTLKMDFGKVTGLKPGKTYVVFEYVVQTDKVKVDPKTGKKTYDKKDVVVKHEDPKDKAQTVVVKKPAEIKIGTTVTAGGVTASAKGAASIEVKDEATKVEFSDLVTYEGLTAGASYTMFGELVEVQADGTVKVVAEAPGAEFRPDASSGTLKVDFGKVSGLRPGMTYVVFEYLVSTDKVKVDAATGKKTYDKADVIAKHDDRNDKAQTVVVKKPRIPEQPKIVTRITANGVTANGQSEAIVVGDENTVVKLTDTVSYENLVVGTSYTMFGKLVEVQDDGTVRVVVEAPGTEFVPTSPNGSMKMEFGQVKGLVPGKKYVAFEYLVHTTDVKKTDDGKKVYERDKVVAKHEDKNDKAQTVVVKRPVPPHTPPTPPTPPTYIPKTGDQGLDQVGLLAVAVAIAGLGAVVYRRTKA